MSGARERQDNMARALAAIIAVTDLTGFEMPPALTEAIDNGRAALAARDGDYDKRVLVVAEHPGEAAEWAERHAVKGGASITALYDGSELATTKPPFTVVVLPGGDRTEDWPRLYARIAAFGSLVDLIRIGRRPAADLTTLGPGRA